MCGVVLRIARAERPGWFREDRVVIITDAGKRGSGRAAAQGLRRCGGCCVCVAQGDFR
eukprot:COSAG02_NODE_505_length_20935_cov_38.509119_2_plen_58_part_00